MIKLEGFCIEKDEFNYYEVYFVYSFLKVVSFKVLQLFEKSKEEVDKEYKDWLIYESEFCCFTASKKSYFQSLEDAINAAELKIENNKKKDSNIVYQRKI